MKKIENIQELHNIQLEMMDKFDKICKDNNLIYFLAGGTLLGAVRHKGFIPWDDDVDLAMPRPDYEKLLSLYTDNKEAFGFLSVVKFGDDGYGIPFAKIVHNNTLIKVGNKEQGGLFIDIFPMDGFGDDLEEAKNQIRYINDTGCRIGRAYLPWNELKFSTKLVKILYTVIGRKKSYNSLLKKALKYDFYKSAYVGSTFGVRVEKEIIERWTFEKTMDMHFEDRVYQAPVGYDQYLKQMYGDYMQLPPEEKRVAPHEFDLYIK
ncbi:lipopolysaccharide cholinephosphotransferase [Pseudobutyrivibrio sp. UC1225]|uniref:LicD family protein n=1 Tax=Pseudobutyrivibrio sp. UC1225 TaxID=1798185 RepID=UPI0008E26ADD|nr:LicD family protein [Pseudobutyrivibrio sp. UC1225]SFO26621.1 lipopolysaccharide cholinephosphotransferase [Pseudobutyrivibrio sp. UC1225]